MTHCALGYDARGKLLPMPSEYGDKIGSRLGEQAVPSVCFSSLPRIDQNRRPKIPIKPIRMR